MDQETLYSKVIQSSKRNRKMLASMMEHVANKKKESREKQAQRYAEYRRQYEELLKLNQQSEQESFRLKKELALIQIEIEQLSLKNTLSRSRIKLQSEQIENIKDETFDVDKKRKKEDEVANSNEQLKDEVARLERQIGKKQEYLENKKKNVENMKTELQGWQQKKEAKQTEHRQNEHSYKNKIESLQAQLRKVKGEATHIRLIKDRQQQEKTKRNNKNEALRQIQQLLQKHKSSYLSREDLQ